MKKRIFIPLILLLLFVLVACGGEAPTLEDISDTAQNAVENVVDTVEDELADTTEEEAEPTAEAVEEMSESMAECNLDAMELTPGYDATLHLINNTGETLSFSWLDTNLDPPALSDRGEIANGETFEQVTFVGHVFVANNADGSPIFEYVVTDAEKQCAVIESTQPIELTTVDTTEGPTGEDFDVDPTQPIEVTDSKGTQVSVDAGGFKDEDGNPPAGDVNVNVFTDALADEGGEAETSAECEVLTVWSYNEETGLWEEEGSAPIQDDRCVEPVGAVAVDVTDDAGNNYDLAEGQTAEVSTPCEPKPDEVLTVWSYDEETGLWVEEGAVVVQEGETCSAEVSDPSNVVFGITDEETPSAPTTTETTNEAGEVELTLASTALIAGDVVAFEGSGTEYIVATGDYFAYLTTEYRGGNSRFGINNGDVAPLIIIANSGISFQATILAGAVAESGNAQAAAQTLDTPSGYIVDSPFRVTSIGSVNQSLQEGDFIEVLLSDANSNEPPYTVNIYRGESRELVSTFTVDKASE